VDTAPSSPRAQRATPNCCTWHTFHGCPLLSLRSLCPEMQCLLGSLEIHCQHQNLHLRMPSPTETNAQPCVRNSESYHPRGLGHHFRLLPSQDHFLAEYLARQTAMAFLADQREVPLPTHQHRLADSVGVGYWNTLHLAEPCYQNIAFALPFPPTP